MSEPVSTEPSPDPVIRLSQAMDFAARKHGPQLRKGPDNLPYIVHLSEVALLLARATAGSDPMLVVAGLLHDVIEDTDTTLEELEREFGRELCVLVCEVTDEKGLSREERRRRQVEQAAGKSARAKMIKIADKTSNLRSIINSPPATWDVRRKLEYYRWAKEVVDCCRGVNPVLEALFDEAYEWGSNLLNGGRQ